MDSTLEDRIADIEEQLTEAAKAHRITNKLISDILTKLNGEKDQPPPTPTPTVPIVPSVPTPTEEPPSNTSGLRPANPSPFNGDRSKGRAFLNSCRIYMNLCRNLFPNDNTRIQWVLSYMNEGRAARFAQRIMLQEDKTGTPQFRSYAEFEQRFRENFCPLNDMMEAVTILESHNYYQRKRSVDEYVDEFEELVERAEYHDGAAVVMKFRHGLNPDIQNRIALLGEGRPTDTVLQEWVKAARRYDANVAANQAFEVTTKVKNPIVRNLFHNPIRQPSAYQVPQAAIPTPAVSHVVPMDIDRTKLKKSTTPIVCHRCMQPGHISRDCPRRYDIRFMTKDEKEDAIADLAASIDTLTVETTQEEVEAEEETEEGPEKQGDFPQYSR